MMLKAKTEELEKKREELKLKRSRLAINAGLSFYSVTRLVDFGNKTSLLRAKAIAKVLKCNVWDIFEKAE